MDLWWILLSGGLPRGEGRWPVATSGCAENEIIRTAMGGLERGPGDLWRHRCGQVTRVAGLHVAGLGAGRATCGSTAAVE